MWCPEQTQIRLRDVQLTCSLSFLLTSSIVVNDTKQSYLLWSLESIDMMRSPSDNHLIIYSLHQFGAIADHPKLHSTSHKHTYTTSTKSTKHHHIPHSHLPHLLCCTLLQLVILNKPLLVVILVPSPPTSPHTHFCMLSHAPPFPQCHQHPFQLFGGVVPCTFNSTPCTVHHVKTACILRPY